MRCVLLSILALSLLISTARAEDDIYNPLAVGLFWESSLDLKTPAGNGYHGTTVREITGTEVINGKTYFKSVTHVMGIIGLPKELITYRRKAADGIYAINGMDILKREYLETALPLTVGKTWTAVVNDKEKVVFKVESQEAVTANDHRYEKCLKVSYHSDGTSPSGYFYAAPHVGNVSETFTQGGATFHFTLKSFSGAK